MIPHFADDAREPGMFFPPSGFRGAGKVSSAGFEKGTFDFLRQGDGSAKSLAQKAGVRYEDQVHEEMVGLYPALYRPAPWLFFQPTFGPPRRCQPDGLLLAPDLIVIL